MSTLGRTLTYGPRQESSRVFMRATALWVNMRWQDSLTLRGYLEPLIPMVAGPSPSAAPVPGISGCAVGAAIAAPTAHPPNEWRWLTDSRATAPDGPRRRPGGVLDAACKRVKRRYSS